MQWVILASSLLIVLLLALIGLAFWLLWNLVKKLMTEREGVQTVLTTQLTNSQQLTRNLMDRMMSQDLQTYATMTTLANSSKSSNTDEYVDRSDEAEWARLNSGQTVAFPVGSTIFTESDHAENFTTEIGLADLTELAEKLDDH